jgi:hypothetical protein
MKIKSKLNGEISNVRGDIAREMVKMGVAEIINDGTVENGRESFRLPQPGDHKPAAPKWEVIERASSEGKNHGTLCIRMTILNQTTDYIGAPEHIRQIGGWSPPENIVRDYTRQWAAHPELRDQLAVEIEDVRARTQNSKAGDALAAANQELKNGRVPWASAPDARLMGTSMFGDPVYLTTDGYKVISED